MRFILPILLDGIKGVYHINAVDVVTQFQCVFSVERIKFAAVLVQGREPLLTSIPARAHRHALLKKLRKYKKQTYSVE